MKLAFSLFRYFPYGGLQRDFYRIAEECLIRNHSVDIFTSAWEGPRDSRLNIHVLPVKGWQNHTRFQRFVTQVCCLTKDYDLNVGFNKMPGLDIYYAADTCFQAKARQQHKAWFRLTPRYRYYVKNEHAVFAKNAHTHILLISQLQRPEFEYFYQTPQTRFHLLPPGIAKDRVAPLDAKQRREAIRKKWQIQSDEFLLLLIGSGFKTKGLDRALRALYALPPQVLARTWLYIIGKDHTKPFLKQVQDLKLTSRIRFLGGRDDVPDFLLAADLLLHPAYNENTGTVLLEALVAGLPVFATDVCGYAHYIEKADAGKVFPSPFDQTAFDVALMQALLSNVREKWQENALNFAKYADIFDLPRHAVDVIEKFGKV